MLFRGAVRVHKIKRGSQHTGIKKENGRSIVGFAMAVEPILPNTAGKTSSSHAIEVYESVLSLVR